MYSILSLQLGLQSEHSSTEKQNAAYAAEPRGVKSKRPHLTTVARRIRRLAASLHGSRLLYMRKDESGAGGANLVELLAVGNVERQNTFPPIQIGSCLCHCCVVGLWIGDPCSDKKWLHAPHHAKDICISLQANVKLATRGQNPAVKRDELCTSQTRQAILMGRSFVRKIGSIWALVRSN